MSNLYIPDVCPPQSPEQELQLRVQFCPYPELCKQTRMEAYIRYSDGSKTIRPAFFVEDPVPPIPANSVIMTPAQYSTIQRCLGRLEGLAFALSNQEMLSFNSTIKTLDSVIKEVYGKQEAEE